MPVRRLGLRCPLCGLHSYHLSMLCPEIVLGPIGMVDDLGAVIMGVATA